MTLDLEESLKTFREDRATFVTFLKTFSIENRANDGTPPEYKKYNSEIFLRHIMMHDYLHMYRIEELWLTNDAFL